ncbi:MAG: G8 domain-containing protein, partial [Paludibacteraceae bacterium]|nr:G8 domain-containing protein [Paludibacteraceae bacterium]
AIIAQTDYYERSTADLTLTVIDGIVFDGSNGSSWSDNSWGGAQPTANDRVIIDADVTITADDQVEVESLTINENKTVTVKDGGVLTVGAGNSLTRTTYGNIIVEAGGQLILGAGDVEVNDFTLYSTFVGGNPKSGQVSNAGQLNAHGEAYFIIDLDKDGVATYGWYNITVPFPVDALRGITRYDNGTWQPMVNEKDYAIMDYHEDLRAQGKYGWKKYRNILQPNTGYLITVDDELGMNRCRFQMAKGSTFNTNTTHNLTASEGDAQNKGWNCIGNGTMTYVSYASTPRYAQMLNHTDNTYEMIRTENNSFVVGAAYFVQAEANSTLTMVDAGNQTTNLLRAPQRTDDENEDCQIDLLLRNADKVCDKLFVTCSEDASATYTIGRDVLKMGATTDAKVARMWTNAKQAVLGAVDMPFNGETAIVPLNMYAPQDGTYTLTIDNQPDEDVYLTRNGIIVWNLSTSDYTFDLNAGTDTTYALQVVRRINNIATGVDATENNNRGTDFVEKMIIDGQLFILRDGILYDAQGKIVTNL